MRDVIGFGSVAILTPVIVWLMIHATRTRLGELRREHAVLADLPPGRSWVRVLSTVVMLAAALGIIAVLSGLI